jgi:signal transduction histidine kinase
VLIARMVIVTGFSLGVAWLMQRQRAQRHQLESANRKLALTATTVEQLAVSHERNRMARELHDTLAHSLSAVSVQLEAVNALWDVEPAEARKILEQATRSTRSGLTEARRALHSLRASPLEDLGLTLAISTLAESVATRANLELELAIPANIDGLQPHVEQCVYRVAQEALENVTRHANASNVRVALEQTTTQLALTVADNGSGFDPTTVNGEHFGIKGMRERAEMAGGRLFVHSAPHEGTQVRLEIGD